LTSRKRRLVLAAPVLVVITMIPVYQLSEAWFGPKLGWYLGFLVYWPLWCLVFPLWAVGWAGIRLALRRRHTPPWAWLVLSAPPLMALLGRGIMGGGSGEAFAWILMAGANGTLEEVLWRGVYAIHFGDSVLWGVAWPTLWFALWHFAPGWVALGSRAWVLVAGAAMFGLAMSWVAHKTRSIRWTIASHLLAGVVQA
jgi:membrane protease YdiL (CAAX protease family)